MSRKAISRRDFLRLGAVLGSGATAASLMPAAPRGPAAASKPNVIIFVFDALSARNMSLYGYARKTTPNFEAFADRAVVYHRHYSSGSFTTPGTASLLTGMHPWTHRAMAAAGLLRRDFANRSVFGQVGDDYNTLGYTQNYWADYLLTQFSKDLQTRVPLADFSAVDDTIVDRRFRHDALVAYRAYESVFFPGLFQQPNSLLFGFLLNWMYQDKVRAATPAEYPLGLPTSNNVHHVYTIESTMDGALEEIGKLEAGGKPYLAYFHLWPPHSPYRPRKEFVDHFKGDGFVPDPKRPHALSTDSSQAKLDGFRQEYDSFIAHLDAEFGRLHAALEAAGVLDGSYVFVTADHGELFERGVFGHFTPVLFEPIIHVPLIVSVPGQRRRLDVHAPTSAVDVVPTILALAGKAGAPAWLEGRLLPELGGSVDAERRVLSLDAKSSPAEKPLSKATLALIRERYKLVHYFGYKNRRYQDFYELYDLLEDPEELHNLAARPRVKKVRDEMEAELRAALAAADEPYL